MLNKVSRELAGHGKLLWQSITRSPRRGAYHGLVAVEGATAFALASSEPILAGLAIMSAAFTLIIARHTG